MSFTMLFRYNVLIFAALYISFVKPQIVLVGDKGAFYSPPTIYLDGSIAVRFEFFGSANSVTQSSFENPCAPLPGGFHSGITGTSTNESVPVWDLAIPNRTTTIWYFCAVTTPVFHCSSGMVGVINPPSQDMYNKFLAAARLVSTTPVISPTAVLTGVGAIASNTPSPSPLFVTLATGDFASLPLPIYPSLGVTVIVGGAVGGGIAVIGLIAIVGLFYLRNKRAPKTIQSDNFFRYNSVPARCPSEVFAEVNRSSENIYHNTPVAASNTNANSQVSTTSLSPVRRSSVPRLPPLYIHRQTSVQFDLTSTGPNSTTSGRNVPEQPSSVDIRALTQEVAAV